MVRTTRKKIVEREILRKNKEYKDEDYEKPWGDKLKILHTNRFYSNNLLVNLLHCRSIPRLIPVRANFRPNVHRNNQLDHRMHLYHRLDHIKKMQSLPRDSQFPKNYIHHPTTNNNSPRLPNKQNHYANHSQRPPFQEHGGRLDAGHVTVYHYKELDVGDESSVAS